MGTEMFNEFYSNLNKYMLNEFTYHILIDKYMFNELYSNLNKYMLNEFTYHIFIDKYMFNALYSGVFIPLLLPFIGFGGKNEEKRKKKEGKGKRGKNEGKRVNREVKVGNRERRQNKNKFSALNFKSWI